MSGRIAKRAFAARPSDAETWVRAREAPSSRETDLSLFTARLTIDVTPEQRGGIKVTAFQRGQTVADMAHASCSPANSPTKMEARNERQRSNPQAVK